MTVKELQKMPEDTALVWHDHSKDALVYFRGIKSAVYMGKNVRVSLNRGDRRSGFGVPARALKPYASDFYVKDHKDVVTVTLVSARAQEWATKNLAMESWQIIPGGFGAYAEHAAKYIERLIGAGFVRGEQVK